MQGLGQPRFLEGAALVWTARLLGGFMAVAFFTIALGGASILAIQRLLDAGMIMFLSIVALFGFVGIILAASRRRQIIFESGIRVSDLRVPESLGRNIDIPFSSFRSALLVRHGSGWYCRLTVNGRTVIVGSEHYSDPDGVLKLLGKMVALTDGQ